MTELHSPVTHECLEIVGLVLACRRCGRSGGEADRSTGSAARDIRPRTRGPSEVPGAKRVRNLYRLTALLLGLGQQKITDTWSMGLRGGGTLTVGSPH